MADVLAHSDRANLVLFSDIHSKRAEEIVEQYQKIPGHDVKYEVDYEGWETPSEDTKSKTTAGIGENHP